MKQYRIRSAYETPRTGVVLNSDTGVSVAAYAEDCVLSPTDPYYELVHGAGFSSQNDSAITGLGSLRVSVVNVPEPTQ
jgi:hypothetical protein